VIEIPRVVAKVVEYRMHTLHCAGCGIATRAKLPEGVPQGAFGPRLQAMMAVCAGRYHLSKRMIEEMVSDFFGVEISLGSISNLEEETSEALAESFSEAARAVQNERVVHADETSWTCAKQKAWMWVAIGVNVAVFLIRRSRGKNVARELLGAAFAGILNSDRWCAYNWVDTRRRQLCWAHLIRHFAGFESYGAEASQLGQELLGLCEWMFEYWHRVRDGTLSRQEFREWMQLTRRAIISCLIRGARGSSTKVAGVCREILQLRGALFTFVREEGVEPTNNTAERAIRPAVLWRKGSFGSDSERGARFVERVMTVVTTLRLQNRNVLDFLTAACEARLRGDPAPALLPIRLHHRIAQAA
jgi:transposase